MSHRIENKIKNDPTTFGILTNLKNKIDQLDNIFGTIKEHLLQLATHLDEEKKCERHEICALIKKLLADKVKEGKITARWIEDSLPSEYKRKYTKSELTSHSDSREAIPISAVQYSVPEFEGNQSIHDSHDDMLDKDILQENVELKEALLKSTAFQNALNQEHKFEVHKEKMVEIIDGLKKCEEICFLIFNSRGVLIKIESDLVTS